MIEKIKTLLFAIIYSTNNINPAIYQEMWKGIVLIVKNRINKWIEKWR